MSDLNQLLQDYFQAQEEYAKLTDALHEAEQRIPIAPSKFLSLEDMEEWEKKYSTMCAEANKLEDQRRTANGDITIAKEKIKNAIPINNVWVRACDNADNANREWGIGKYYDTWGGGHYEIEIKLWEECKEPPIDHTYYP